MFPERIVFENYTKKIFDVTKMVEEVKELSQVLETVKEPSRTLELIPGLY